MSEEKKQETAAQAAPQKKEEAGSAAKNKKINRFTLKELEKQIELTQQKMGNLSSAYARQLLRRKEQLLSIKKAVE